LSDALKIGPYDGIEGSRLYHPSQPHTRDKVDKAINLNAWNAWDPPATQKTNDLYNQLNGMSATDREAFSKLNLMQYYGAMPVLQFNELADRDSGQ
jgi:hypothetical protein